MKEISTNKAPEAIGPYSQGILALSKEVLFVSGQIPIEPDTGRVLDGPIEEQTLQALKNLKAVVEAGGLSLENLVKVTVFLTDMSLYARMNRIYEEFFKGHRPARAVVEVSALPKGVSIEIEGIAVRE